MPNHRTYTDDELRAAVAGSSNWSAVMVALGKKSGTGTDAVKAVAERLRLDISHFAHKQSFRPVAGTDVPFSNPIKHAGQSGLSIAARWFLDRGYIVSVPLEPAPYDLVTESDEGLKRVQVKSTQHAVNNGRYATRIARNAHDPTASRNTNGNRRHVPYTADEIDYFFIVTPPRNYLIPIGVVEGLASIILDVKYAAFAV